jgi:hypothetical protein
MKRITLTLVLLFAISLHSQNVFREDFSTFNINQSLSGQGNWTNSSNTYGLGSCNGTSCVNSTVAQQTVGYLNWGTANRSVILTPNGDGCGFPFTSQQSGVFYMGFVIRITDCSYTSNDFIHLTGASTQATALKVHIIKTSATQYNIGLSKSSGNIVWSSTPYALNTNQLVILKYTFNPDTNDDILLLHTNPNINNAEPTITSALTNSGVDYTAPIDRMILNQMSPNAPSGRISLFSMGSNWNSLKFSALDNTPFNVQQFGLIHNTQNQTFDLYNGADSGLYEIELFSSLGQKVWSSSIELQSESVTQLAMNTSLTKGMYLMQISNRNNQKVIKKLMVN